eukprot:scaffold68735_cov66-Phaeocystis_antarctica.AAC.1
MEPSRASKRRSCAASGTTLRPRTAAATKPAAASAHAASCWPTARAGGWVDAAGRGGTGGRSTGG